MPVVGPSEILLEGPSDDVVLPAPVSVELLLVEFGTSVGLVKDPSDDMLPENVAVPLSLIELRALDDLLKDLDDNVALPERLPVPLLLSVVKVGTSEGLLKDSRALVLPATVCVSLLEIGTPETLLKDSSEVVMPASVSAPLLLLNVTCNELVLSKLTPVLSLRVGCMILQDLLRVREDFKEDVLPTSIPVPFLLVELGALEALLDVPCNQIVLATSSSVVLLLVGSVTRHALLRVREDFSEVVLPTRASVPLLIVETDVNIVVRVAVTDILPVVTKLLVAVIQCPVLTSELVIVEHSVETATDVGQSVLISKSVTGPREQLAVNVPVFEAVISQPGRADVHEVVVQSVGLEPSFGQMVCVTVSVTSSVLQLAVKVEVVVGWMLHPVRLKVIEVVEQSGGGAVDFGQTVDNVVSATTLFVSHLSSPSSGSSGSLFLFFGSSGSLFLFFLRPLSLFGGHLPKLIPNILMHFGKWKSGSLGKENCTLGSFGTCQKTTHTNKPSSSSASQFPLQMQPQ
jgi:hypothetical protein